ncbi:MAG: thymidylate synthase [Candidatus Lokiarchaeota archaeon]|nr:thymidylate synthase [Candidatus Lokiarchaeota archaeon]
MNTFFSLIFLYSLQKDERFIENLLNVKKFCISCGEEKCDDCRDNYGPFSENIVGVYQLPESTSLSSLIDEPESFLPEDIPEANVLIVVNLHGDILTSIPEFAYNHGIKLVIVPIEIGELVPEGLERQVSDELDNYKIEYAFPRPFCALMKNSKYPLLNEFIDYFHLGYPKMDFKIENNRIIECEVKTTAPCGSTFYICRELVRNNTLINKKLKELISKSHHAYPCNASMKEDPVLGDTTLHIAGYIHREAIYSAILEKTHDSKARIISDLKKEIEELRKNSFGNAK